MNIKETLKRLKELESEATPGPWSVYSDGRTGQKSVLSDTPNQVGCSEFSDEPIYEVCQSPNPNGFSLYGLGSSPEFIAESRNALPMLVEALEEAIELIDEVSLESEEPRAELDAEVRPTGLAKKATKLKKKWGLE